MIKEQSKNVVAISSSLPTIVMGTLIGLKFAGMTTLSYLDIFWYCMKVWLAVAAIVVAIFMLIKVLMIVFSTK